MEPAPTFLRWEVSTGAVGHPGVFGELPSSTTPGHLASGAETQTLGVVFKRRTPVRESLQNLDFVVIVLPGDRVFRRLCLKVTNQV